MRFHFTTAWTSWSEPQVGKLQDHNSFRERVSPFIQIFRIIYIYIIRVQYLVHPNIHSSAQSHPKSNLLHQTRCRSLSLPTPTSPLPWRPKLPRKEITASYAVAYPGQPVDDTNTKGLMTKSLGILLRHQRRNNCLLAPDPTPSGPNQFDFLLQPHSSKIPRVNTAWLVTKDLIF